MLALPTALCYKVNVASKQVNSIQRVARSLRAACVAQCACIVCAQQQQRRSTLYESFKDIVQAVMRDDITVEQVMMDDKMRLVVFQHLVEDSNSPAQAVYELRRHLEDYVDNEVDNWDSEEWCSI